MPKGMPRTKLWDCRFDHIVVAATAQGYGKELVLSGIESFDRADDIRRGIYRCSRHRKISAEAGPNRVTDEPGAMGIHKTGKSYELRFRLWDKRSARKRHIERYGADRANWPYDPRRKATADERESWAPRNERGEPVIH
jgi:hypothetical protein